MACHYFSKVVASHNLLKEEGEGREEEKKKVTGGVVEQAPASPAVVCP